MSRLTQLHDWLTDAKRNDKMGCAVLGVVVLTALFVIVFVF